MQPKSSILFKVLLNRFHSGAGEAFLKKLPEEDVKEILKQTLSSQDAAAALTLSRDILTRVHYSWLAPVIEKMPKELYPAIITSLPASQQLGLKKLLKIQFTSYSLSPAVKSFFLNKLWNQWSLSDTLPIEYVPPSSLGPLLELTKAELVELIDLLALHDLAEGIRHIVAKKNLKAIYLCLSPLQQQFLRICLHKKEKLSAPKLDLNKWNGSQENLNAMLHRRGLLRLGKALCGQRAQLIWYVSHTLDTGRGHVIMELYHEDEIPGVTSALVQQVISVINFLKLKGNA